MQDRNTIVQNLKKAGGQYATIGRYCHPSHKKYIIDSGPNREIFDLEKTSEVLESTLEAIKQLGAKKQIILFVSSRRESLGIIEDLANTLSLPYMTERWIGGTLSNFKNIRSRVDRMVRLEKEKEEGVWEKHTKKERILIQRELEKLQSHFTGIKNLSALPAAVCIVDTKREVIAVKEAQKAGIPIIGISNADANLQQVTHPIIANIHSRDAMEYIASLISDAYLSGTKE